MDLKKVFAPLNVATYVYGNDEYGLDEIVVTSINMSGNDQSYELRARKVVFGENVTSIFDGIVLESEVEELEFSGNVTSISGLFIYGSEEGTSIVIPETITYINASNIQTPVNTYVTLLFKGSEADCQVEGEFIENVTVVWDYVEEPDDEELEEN